MFSTAHLFSSASTSLTGSSGSSSPGSYLIVIFLIALGIVWFLGWLISARQTVVVVEQASGLAGLLALLVVAGIFILFVIGSSSGLT